MPVKPWAPLCLGLVTAGAEEGPRVLGSVLGGPCLSPSPRLSHRTWIHAVLGKPVLWDPLWATAQCGVEIATPGSIARCRAVHTSFLSLSFLSCIVGSHLSLHTGPVGPVDSRKFRSQHRAWHIVGACGNVLNGFYCSVKSPCGTQWIPLAARVTSGFGSKWPKCLPCAWMVLSRRAGVWVSKKLSGSLALGTKSPAGARRAGCSLHCTSSCHGIQGSPRNGTES